MRVLLLLQRMAGMHGHQLSVSGTQFADGRRPIGAATIRIVAVMLLLLMMRLLLLLLLLVMVQLMMVLMMGMMMRMEVVRMVLRMMVVRRMLQMVAVVVLAVPEFAKLLLAVERHRRVLLVLVECGGRSGRRIDKVFAVFFERPQVGRVIVDMHLQLGSGGGGGGCGGGGCGGRGGRQ